MVLAVAVLYGGILCIVLEVEAPELGGGASSGSARCKYQSS